MTPEQRAAAEAKAREEWMKAMARRGAAAYERWKKTAEEGEGAC